MALSTGRGSVGGWVEGVRGKIAGLQEALEAAQAEQGHLEKRLAMAARQHKADLSDAQLQVQVQPPGFSGVGYSHVSFDLKLMPKVGWALQHTGWPGRQCVGFNHWPLLCGLQPMTNQGAC